jgi:ATP/maltotriose-dependent transcriptional regulator MalT
VDWREKILALGDQLGLLDSKEPAAESFFNHLRRAGLAKREDGNVTNMQEAPLRHPTVSTTAVGEALSARELVVLQLVARGMRNKQAAAELNISEHTVRWHVRNVLEKLNVTNRTAAVNSARELGLLTS